MGTSLSTENRNWDKILSLKKQLLNVTMISIFIMAMPGFLASFYQTYQNGFQTFMILHWAIFFCFLGTIGFSRFFSDKLKLITILTFWIIIGVTGLFSLELMPFIVPILLCVSFLGTLILGTCFGFLGIGFTLLTSIMAHMHFHYQWIGYQYTLNYCQFSHSAWFYAIVCIILLGGVLVFFLGKLQREFFETIQKLNINHNRLVDSERQLKESKLQNIHLSENMLDLFEHMLDAFALHELILDDNNQPKDYRFLLVNPAFETMTGLKSEQLIGKTILEVFPKTEFYWIQTYGKVALTGSPIKFENYSQELNRYFEVKAYCPASGQFACIFQDITRRKKAEDERKDLENQLRQSHKMEALGTLAGGLAHDFNNYLMPVMGYTEMLLEDYSDNNDIQSSLNEILKAAKRGKQLAEQVLTFSRRANHQFIPINLETIILETLPMLRASIPRSIDIVDHIETHDQMIMGDPVQFQQVILNLCNNAYHAIEKDNGRIIISLKVETVNKKILLWNGDQLPEGEYLRLKIEDNGHGIDTETQEKIFDPYFTTKEKGRGTGLGLSVVLGIINRFNGSIKLTSAIGKGTRFDIYFPLITETIKAQHDNNDNNSFEVGVENILLVDDEPSILDVEKKMLTRLGYNVITCLNGIEAKKIFKDNPDFFDLVITDLSMPGLAGDQLAEQLTLIRPDINVILFTGYSEEQSFVSTQTSIKAMLTKPILKKELARVIRKVIDNHKCDDES